MSLILGSGRSSGGGYGNSLWCSCLENPMDRGAWQATVHRVTKSWTPLKQLSMHACIRVFSPQLESQSAVYGDCQVVSKKRSSKSTALYSRSMWRVDTNGLYIQLYRIKTIIFLYQSIFIEKHPCLFNSKRIKQLFQGKKKKKKKQL